MLTGYDQVPSAEAVDRRNRILSVACPHCGAAVDHACQHPSATTETMNVQHGARWEAWYATHPEASQ